MATYENFGAIVRAVLYDLGYASLSDAGADVVAAVKRAVNDAHRDMHNRTAGRWRQKTKHYRLADKVEVADGVGVSVGATTVTIDPTDPITLTDAFLGRTILFEDSLLPYTIVGYDTDAAPDEITISPAYAGDAALSDAACDIYDTHLVMPDDFADVVSVAHMTDNTRIRPMPMQEVRRRFANPWSQSTSGRPTVWVLDGRLELSSPSATANERPWRLWLRPVSGAAFDLEVVYYQVVNEMTDDADEPLVPAEYRQYLKAGAFVACNAWSDKDPRALGIANASFKSGIEAMNGRRKNVQAPLQFGSVMDGRRSGVVGNLPEDDVYAAQWEDPSFWP